MIPMKELDNILGRPYLTKINIQDMVMHTSEPYSTREATDSVVKITNSTYTNASLDKVSAKRSSAK